MKYEYCVMDRMKNNIENFEGTDEGFIQAKDFSLKNEGAYILKVKYNEIDEEVGCEKVWFNEIDFIWEWCDDCNEEVILENKFIIQTCPNCHHKIKPCSLCDMDMVNCNNCLCK